MIWTSIHWWPGSCLYLNNLWNITQEYLFVLHSLTNLSILLCYERIIVLLESVSGLFSWQRKQPPCGVSHVIGLYLTKGTFSSALDMLYGLTELSSVKNTALFSLEHLFTIIGQIWTNEVKKATQFLQCFFFLPWNSVRSNLNDKLFQSYLSLNFNVANWYSTININIFW